MDKKWLTTEFWAGVLGSLAALAVTLGLLSQDVATTWVQLLMGLVAAVLPIVALIIGYSRARAAMVRSALALPDAPGWRTGEFWMTIAATVAMVLVAARIISQEQADMWLQLIGPLVGAILAIVAYVTGRAAVKTAAIGRF